MNIKHFLSAAAALTMLAACSDYDPGTSGNAIDLTDAEIKTIEEYTANFVNRYGGMDPNHTWGFGAKGSEDEMGTRIVESDNNSNQWGKAQGGDQYAYITDIPGYPHVTDNSPYNGKYEVKNGNTYSLKTKAELLSTDVPVGDVTEEEILYVSEWFRSHQLSDGGTCPYTDFFVQDISADVDIQQYPTWKEGATYTSVEALADRTNMNANPAYPYDKTNKSYVTSATFKLDRLCITDQQTNVLPTTGNTQSDIWDHTLNFNNGSTNNKPLDADAPNSGRTLTHVRSTNNPVDFACNSSDDATYYKNWTMQHLTFVGPSGKQYDGYYLGFDYECHKTTDNVHKERDYHYNNWIVKISPSNPYISDHKWHRIMCEDLGSTDDYDFNDLVFDVYYTGTGADADPYIAHIRIQASGGTLPIYIGQKDYAHETHRLLQGNNVEYNASTNLYSPINVGYSSVRGIVTADPVDITLNMTNIIKQKNSGGANLAANEATNPDRIPIFVGTFTSDERKAFVLPERDRTDAAPQKICIDGKKQPNANQVRWMRERQQIEDTYTYFKYWVNTENSEYDYGKANDWTQTGLQKTENLY